MSFRVFDDEIFNDFQEMNICRKVFKYKALNNDVVTEMLLHMPVQSLLRFKAVSKFWHDVIDSPSFRKRHTNNTNNDNTVYLEFTFISDNVCQQKKLSIKLLDNGKLLKPYSGYFNDFPALTSKHLVTLVGAIKGLICIYCMENYKLPIAICNPFLGQLKILPKSPHFDSCGIYYDEDEGCRYSDGIRTRYVGIGFDGEDYKVVELLYCTTHQCRHAQLYSRRLDSWRDLGNGGGVLDQALFIEKPIKSLCKNGYFAHWRGSARLEGDVWEKIILSFDMKSEVFRVIPMRFSTTLMPGLNLNRQLRDKCNTYWDYSSISLECRRIEIIAKDECSFLLFVLPYNRNGASRKKLMSVYESRFEDSKLIWDHVIDLKQPSLGMTFGRSDCVVLRNFYREDEVVFYDHRARKFIGCLNLSAKSEIVPYNGSFISP